MMLETDITGIGGPKAAVFSEKPIAPLPLLSYDLDLGRTGRNCDELVPDNQPGCQHGCDTDSGHYGEPPFKLLVFGLVGCLPSLLVTEAEDTIAHQSNDPRENATRDPELHGDRLL